MKNAINAFDSQEQFSFSRNNLDLIRLLAAFQVLLIHAEKHMQLHLSAMKWLSLFPGVPIFFFISGILIYRSYSKSGSLGDYVRNRVLRIYPALWICTLTSVVMLFGVGYLNGTSLDDVHFWYWLIGQVSFVQFYNPNFLPDFGVGVLNGSLWTISIELQFYILTPVVFWLVSNSKTWSIIVFGFFIGLNAFRDYMPFEGIIAKLYGVTFFPWLGMTILGNGINIFSFVCLAMLIVKLAYTKPELSRKLLSNNDISYGMYIYHMPVINLFIYWGLIKSIYYLLVVICIVVILAMLSWFIVEKPALAFKRKTIRA